WCRNCSATATSQRPRSTPTSINPASRRSTRSFIHDDRSAHLTSDRPDVARDRLRSAGGIGGSERNAIAHVAERVEPGGGGGERVGGLAACRGQERLDDAA